MNRSTLTVLGVFTFVLLGLTGSAEAYIGPGAGLTAIGAFIALVIAVVVSLVAFVWLPLRRLMRKTRSKAALPTDTAADDV